MYVTIRSWKSSIMNQIGREKSELFALYFKKTVILNLVYNLSSANIDQSVLNLGRISMSNRIWMSLIFGPIWTGTTGVICSWIRKLWIAAFDFVKIYSLSSTKYKPISSKLDHNVQGSPQKFLKAWWHLVALSSWVVLQMLLKVLPNFKWFKPLSIW